MRIRTDEEIRSIHAKLIEQLKSGSIIGAALHSMGIDSSTFYARSRALQLDVDLKKYKPGFKPPATNGNAKIITGFMKYVPTGTEAETITIEYGRLTLKVTPGMLKQTIAILTEVA